MRRPVSHLPALLPAVILVAGTLLFLAGGSQHPNAGSAFGTVGTPEFYRAFAAGVHHHPNWIPIHVLILLGPLFWALGTPRLVARNRDRAIEIAPAAHDTLGDLANRSLLLGAGFWVVTFVIDGFVAPTTAALIAVAAPGEVSSLVADFRLHQVVVIRLGLFSWILIAAAAGLHGAVLLGLSRGSVWRKVLGTWGIAVGLWPLVAVATGDFDPGPFTSAHWNVTALSTAFWFAAFGVSFVADQRQFADRATAAPLLAS